MNEGILQMNMKHFALATTALVGGMMLAGAASAQSTASQATEVDKVVVTASGQRAVSGLIAETAPKSKSSINQEYIDKQPAGQTILDTLNQTPGLSFTNNDPYGSSGGNVRLRGFDGNRISLTFDGIPLNDTGNYAIYTNQQLDGELISRASVNMGTTDVDSPTASAVGGTINYTTLTPTSDFSGMLRAVFFTHHVDNLPIFFNDIMRRDFGCRIGQPLNCLRTAFHSGIMQDEHGDGQSALTEIRGRIPDHLPVITTRQPDARLLKLRSF